ncbi:HEAT repeat domain-containing protein [Clostridium sp. UBA4548]|uniref:HEAT repeat domain-containing protein n=1 Tax=Clostridium sp. UBA4548 TaxID=1946361 RepID=UPI0025C732AF|nr:HEAT repeat domain-containing protein [Clostridium sp. UBA4548]
MSDICNAVEVELIKFNKWAQEYLKSVNYYGEWETEYPEWESLYEVTFKAIYTLTNDDNPERTAKLILEVMALDNECERVLGECEDTLDDGRLKTLCEVGVSHTDWNARWQIAELLGRRKISSSEKYLLKLVCDEVEYVIRRALYSLAKVNPSSAEKVAIENLNSKYEYLRFAALVTLYDISSQYFDYAIKRLENDESKIIKVWINNIKD